MESLLLDFAHLHSAKNIFDVCQVTFWTMLTKNFSRVNEMSTDRFPFL